MHALTIHGDLDLMRILEADSIEVERGDLVCLYSGFGDLVVSSSGTLDTTDAHPARCCELDGRDQRLLRWIDATGLAALISEISLHTQAFTKPVQDSHVRYSFEV